MSESCQATIAKRAGYTSHLTRGGGNTNSLNCFCSQKKLSFFSYIFPRALRLSLRFFYCNSLDMENTYAQGSLKPGHYKIMSYEIVNQCTNLLAWNARETRDTVKSDATILIRRFLPSRERSSVLLAILNVKMNKTPQQTKQPLLTLRQGR